MPKTEQKQPNEQIEKREPTISERFLAKVEKQYLAELGGDGLSFTPLERRLAQHVYLKVDQALKAAEAKRLEKGSRGAEFIWKNVNTEKLALDTVHRVSLGLDALIPNHVHAVFYWNSRLERYDVDLQIGYAGRDFMARKHSADPVVDITYELVYSTDYFKPLPRSLNQQVESYEFAIEEPFNRGDIVGGFGYIRYEDERKNRLVIVTPRDFERSKKASRGGFWSTNDVEMHMKTVVHRVASKIRLDTEKVNSTALAAVISDEYSAEDRAVQEVTVEAAQHANRRLVDVGQKRAERPTIDVTPGEAAAGAESGAESAPVEHDEPVPVATEAETEDESTLFPEADF